MNMHEAISTDIGEVLCAYGAIRDISPTSIALALQTKYRRTSTKRLSKLEPHIEYTSLQHLKQMARKALSGKFGPDGDGDDERQQDLFAGLQPRYPTPHKRGEEPIYKLRDFLSDEEVQWNIKQLRRSARARLMHADALAAWAQSRKEDA